MGIRLQGRYGVGVKMPNELEDGKLTDDQFRNPLIHKSISTGESLKKQEAVILAKRTLYGEEHADEQLAKPAPNRTADSFRAVADFKYAEYQEAKKYEQLASAAEDIFGEGAVDIVTSLWQRYEGGVRG